MTSYVPRSLKSKLRDKAFRVKRDEPTEFVVDKTVTFTNYFGEEREGV
jgi:hypothetical protein